MEQLIGKTIESIKSPDELEVNKLMRYDGCIIITFTDGTTFKLASWDYEGYSSGIDVEIKLTEEEK